MICGIVGQGFFSYFSFLSIKQINVSENGIIQGLIPIFILIIGFMRHDAKFSCWQLIAALGAFIGVVLLVLDPSSNNGGFNISHLFALAGVLCFSSNAYLRDALAAKYGALLSMYYQFFFVSITFALLMLLTGKGFSEALIIFVSKKHLLSVCILGIGISALSYQLYIYAMKIIGVDGAAMALNLTSLSSFLLAVVLLGEVVTTRRSLAILVVILSMMIFVKMSKKNDGVETV